MKIQVSLPLVLLSTLLSTSVVAAAAAPPTAASSPSEQAAFQFTVGKLLASEGSLTEGLAAVEEAQKLNPNDPYIHLEHAQILTRVAAIVSAQKTRTEYLGKAAQEVMRAGELAPGNPDVLRGTGEAYLALADQDPKALGIAESSFEALRRLNPSDLQVMVTLGRIYLEEGQAGRAADVLRELVTYTPENPTIYSLLVEALLKADRKPEAEKALKEVLSFAPDSLQSRLTLAEVQGQIGDHKGALDTLLGAPDTQREDPQLRRQLASALYLNGDLDSALKTADDLLKVQPENQYLELLKALVLTAQGRNTEALTLLTRLRENDPQDLTLSATLARVLRRAGKKEEAAKLLSDLAANLAKDGKVKESSAATLELAQLYATTNDWQKESEVLEPLLHSEEPTIRTDALLLKADALVELKKFDDAEALLGPVGSSSPALAAKEGEVLWKAGKERQAKRELSRLSRSEDPQTLLAAAQSYQRLEQYGESIPLLNKVLVGHPDLPTAGFLLGAAYERTGKRDQAVAALRKVLKTDPDFHAGLNYLGYMWAEKGENLKEALSMIQRAVTLDPDNGAYVDSLGWTHYRLGQYEPARTYLERAARLVPEDATVHEHLGDVYVALGEREKAREMYRRALDLGDHNAHNADQIRHKLDELDSASHR